MTCREGDQQWRTCRPIAVPVGVQDGAGPSMLLNHHFPYEKFSFLACPVFQTLQSLAKDVYIDTCWTAATTRAVQLGLLWPEFADLEFHQKYVCLQWHCIWECPCFFPKNITSSPYSYWLVVWNMAFIFHIFPIILGSCHHPNWRTHSIIFQRGRSTSNLEMWRRWRRSSSGSKTQQDKE